MNGRRGGRRAPELRASPPGRPPTAAERKRFEEIFPGLKGETFTITDDKGEGRYNCWGYAIDCTKYGGPWEPPNKNPERARAFEESLREHGWVPSKDCKRKKGFRKLALYCSNMPKPSEKAGDLSNHDILHAAKELVEAEGWESKDGEKERFTHPTPESIVSKKFDHLCGCWEKPLDRVLKDAKQLLADLKKARKALEPVGPLDQGRADWLDSCVAEAERTVREVEARQASEAKPN